MSKTKKIISLLLSVIMIMSVFTIVPFSAGAAETDTAETGAESGTTGDCTWTLDDNGVLTISGNGKMGNYDGTYINGTYVSTAPWYSYSFTTVVIENGVTSIGDFAFCECTKLKSVTIPDSVTSIGVFAFSGCTKLTSVTIPDSVTSIDYGAFFGCTGLSSVTIPDSVTSIGWVAFRGCKGLTSVTIGNSVTSIDDDAFYDCTGLTSVNIPDSVTSIGNRSFGYYFAKYITKKVVGFTIYGYEDSEAENYATENGFKFISLGKATPDEATEPPTQATPDEATEPPTQATPDEATEPPTEAHVHNLVAIDEVPATTESFGTKAYYFCTECYERFWDATGTNKVRDGFALLIVPLMPEEATPDESQITPSSGVTGDCTWSIDGTVLTISGNGKMANYDSGKLPDPSPWEGTAITEVIIEDGVTNVGSWAFKNCEYLESVTIGDSVTSIGEAAFHYCKRLKNVRLGDSVIVIKDLAFCGCTSLTSIDIPDSVTTIKNHAIGGCYYMPSIVIPASVADIDTFAVGWSVIFMGGESEFIRGDFTVYGYEGSAAEDYANQYEAIGFVKLDDKSDEATGIILSVPEAYVLNVDTVTGQDAAVAAANLPDEYRATAVYDIYLTEDGEAVQPGARLPVKIPCDNPDAKVYRKEADGSLTDMNATDKDGYKAFYSDHFSIYVVAVPDARQTGVTVSGSIKSYIDDSDVTLKLTGTDNNYTNETKGTADYTIADVPAGEYTLTVSKDKHITREYTVTVGDTDVTQDVEICPLGDVTGDGKTNVQDCTAILRYVRKLDTLSDDQLKIGDVTGDGKVNVQDVTRILRHVRKIEALY